MAAVDQFEIGNAIIIKNEHFKLNAVINENFIKTIDDTEFINMDFYKSRSVYSMMACRVPSDLMKSSRGLSNVLKNVCREIREIRDAQFRQSVIDEAHEQTRKFDIGVTPKCKRMRAVALAKSDILSVHLPAIDNVVGEVTCKMIVEVCQRRNGNNVLWIAVNDLQVIDYISKIVLHKALQAAPIDEAQSPDNAAPAGGGA